MQKVYRITGVQVLKNRIELTDGDGRRFNWPLPETCNVKAFRVGQRLMIQNGTGVIQR